jgi:flagellar basal body-associated protein FliL
MNDTNETTSGKKVSVSVPITSVATLILLAAGTAAYLLVSRQDEEETPTQKPRTVKSIRKRFGLLTLVTLIENDSTRKVVLALLRAMAKRA